VKIHEIPPPAVLIFVVVLAVLVMGTVLRCTAPGQPFDPLPPYEEVWS
jgi:hypothetical protein